jgi:sugar lactone lactonase YvrE
MSIPNPELFLDGLTFGECPRWHQGRLWLSDMFGHRVIAVSLDGTIEEVVRMEHPAGLGWLPDGRMLVVAQPEKEIKVIADGRVSTWAKLDGICTGNPNDMIVDSRGRAYVGSTGADLKAGEDLGPSELILVEDGWPRVVIPYPTMAFPNGMAITPDEQHLIVAETIGNRLTIFDIDPTDGSLSGRRVFAELGDHLPDGICIDEASAVWFGSFVRGEFVRVRDGGIVTDIIPVGDRRAAACVLGGEDRKTLYLLSADTVHEKLMRGISSGRIDQVRVNVAGAGIP